MAEGHEKTDAKIDTGVAKFYEGKSIFMTGAAGFVGVVLLEILLRCCPGIKTIYLLLREKKGVRPEDRKEELFKRTIFKKLLADEPYISDKVHVVAGDCSLPDLGMREEDMSKVITEVTVVFHCAASISFTKPMKFLLSHNAGGVEHIVELCKRLKCCEALVYTSTAYSNCNRRLRIEERVYKLPYPAERFMQAMREKDDAMLSDLCSDCQPAWPNHYTFSKCLAENLLVEKASDIPTALIRPSLISHAWKGALPGYAEENSSLFQLFIAQGKGFLKVLKIDPNLPFDFVPVDVVANAHVIAGWAIATGRCSSPFVVNCTSDGSYDFRFGAHANIHNVKLFSQNPVPNSLRYSNHCWLTNHPIKFKFLSFFEHYVPAVGLDLTLLLQGKKPRLVRLYGFLDRVMEVSTYFVCHSWTYRTENFKSLQQIVSQQEKEVFHTDLQNLDFKKFTDTLVSGAPFYDWKTDKKSRKERIKLTNRVYYFTLFTQAAFVILLCFLIYMVMSRVADKFLVH